jgi:integrase
MHNSAWQNARKRSAQKYSAVFGHDAPWGFAHVRIHDFKRTFGRRLRAAGVPEETRAVLLGHKTRSMPTHYSVAELAELLAAVNRIDRSRRLQSRCCARVRERVTQNSRRNEKGPGFDVPNRLPGRI